MRFLDGWATELNYSPDENIWWGEVIGLKGKTVHITKSIPPAFGPVETERLLVLELVKFTETHKAPDYRQK